MMVTSANLSDYAECGNLEADMSLETKVCSEEVIPPSVDRRMENGNQPSEGLAKGVSLFKTAVTNGAQSVKKEEEEEDDEEIPLV